MVHALLSAMDDWLKSLETEADIGAVLFDLTKAFDTVPPRALLVVLNKDLIKWVASHLTGRNNKLMDHVQIFRQ